MAADLSSLVPEFKVKVEQVLLNCELRGIQMRPFETLRSPFKQARLWRQSRSGEEIRQKIAELKSGDASFLAFCIESVGPQSGIPVTKAIPGLSWHQWGEAVDCFWLVQGKASWDTKLKVNGINGYAVYAEESENLGLDSGYFWKKFRDVPHVQFRNQSSPLQIYTLPQIDRIMRERFGESSPV